MSKRKTTATPRAKRTLEDREKDLQSKLDRIKTQREIAALRAKLKK